MILHGKDLKITKSDDSTLVALARSCDINVDCDEIEVSSATTGKWRDFISGRLSWSITVNYLVTAGGVASDVLKVGTTVGIKVADGSTGTPMTGTAIIKSCKVTATKGSLSQGSFQFTGKGALTTSS